MPNISYFEVLADDVTRVKRFYVEVLEWDFMRTQVPGIPVEYWNITTGKSRKDTPKHGGTVKAAGTIIPHDDVCGREGNRLDDLKSQEDGG